MIRFFIKKNYEKIRGIVKATVRCENFLCKSQWPLPWKGGKGLGVYVVWRWGRERVVSGAVVRVKPLQLYKHLAEFCAEEKVNLPVSERWCENIKQQISQPSMKRVGELASGDHVASVLSTQMTSRSWLRRAEYLPYQLFNLDETGFKFKHKVEDVMVLYTEVYKDMQRKAKQPKITFFFMKP